MGAPAPTPSSMPATTARLLLLAVVLWAPGCVTAHMTFGRPLAEPAVVARIEPGVTTRAELLDWLGPPDELLSPMPTERARIDDPVVRRVLVERDLFRRRLLTWEYERREDAMLILFPYVNLFTHWRTWHDRDRLLVELDGAGVVSHVAVSREIE